MDLWMMVYELLDDGRISEVHRLMPEDSLRSLMISESQQGRWT